MPFVETGTTMLTNQSDEISGTEVTLTLLKSSM